MDLALLLALGNALYTIHVCLLAEAESYNGARYGRGKGPVYLNTLQCSGSEDTLVECRRRSYFGQVTPSCRGHSRDVSILCGSKKILT